jgi:branched-chain amino acid transport system ATP-binding protein
MSDILQFSQTGVRHNAASLVPPALELSGVTKHFGGVKALTDVSFRLADGQVLGLIGPNGAGKTTLLNIISGFSKPSSGSIRLSGQDITPWPAYKVASVGGVSRTFQNIRMFQGMSVLENVLTGYHARLDTSLLSTILHSKSERRQEKEAREHAEIVLKSLGRSAYGSRRADELSYGIQRRVEIARALVSSPKLLLLDEPTAGMTPRETNEVMDLIHSLRERDLTMIVIEHKAGFIMGVSDQVVVLNFGNVIANGLPDHVRKDPDVVKAYLGTEDAHS